MIFSTKDSKRSLQRVITVMAMITIMAILFFGLRPKAWSIINNIEWLSNKNALGFHNPSIAYVDDFQAFGSKHHSKEFTIHLIVTSANPNNQGFRPILMVHDGDDSNQLTIWHWGSSVIVMNGDDYDNTRKSARISAVNALTPGKVTFLTVTSSIHGTRLFINEKSVEEHSSLTLSLPDAGTKSRLVLGNSVYGKHGWEGEIYGLALYGKAFSLDEVRGNYNTWISQKDLSREVTDEPLLLYTFQESRRNVVLDQSGHNQTLQMPLWPIVIQNSFLTVPWHNANLGVSFVTDAILNLIGFVLLGAVIYVWFRKSHLLSEKYSFFISVAFCFFLSLFMETLQVWLPNRTSSLLDLALNTIGAYLGIILIKILSQQGKIFNI